MLPFLTKYDPLGGSSGSIDPLGALRCYGALADLLLPNITTITTRSRYLTMLCAALANAEALNTLPGPSGFEQRRKAVEPFERLWAVACVAAREEGHLNAADGLRGITYAEKIFQSHAPARRNVNCDFALLKYQSRTGAVGTYWTTLTGGQLVHDESGILSSEGHELAEQFPELPMDRRDRIRFADPLTAHRVWIAWDDLLAWSKACHLQAAYVQERRLLGEALTANDRREYVSRAISQMGNKIPDVWDTITLRRLAKLLSQNPKAVALGLPIILEAIVVMEQFHEAMLRLFEILLWWGTQNSSTPISELVAGEDFRKAADRCRETARGLLRFREGCERLDVRNAIEGMSMFAIKIDRCRMEREVAIEVLEHHHRVQSGKLDGGMPKRDWISWDNTSLLRPSPRFQRKELPLSATGIAVTHPYRLEQFIYMLQENDVLALT